jgi:hypothetical protein
MQRTSVNAGSSGRLCLNLFNHSETAVSHLNGRTPDRREVQASYISYAWILLANCTHIVLDGVCLFPA